MMDDQVESSQVETVESKELDTESTANKSMASGLSGDTSCTASTPNISSYFNQAVEDDPFGSIVTESTKERSTSAPAHPAPALPSVGESQEQSSIFNNELSNQNPPSVHDVSETVSDVSPAETNRMFDAWIPTETTRRFLVQALATGGKFHLPPDKVLKPRLAMADTQADPVYQETFKLRGEVESQKKQTLNLNNVEQNMSGLQQLIKAECWRSALDLTVILLTNMNQGLQPVGNSMESVISESSMKVWAVRVSLLTKLRMYSIAEAECQQFSHMDSPELHFEFHHQLYPGRNGSMVPFSLRLLYACLPQFLGRHNESLDRLFYIREQVTKILHNLQSGGCEDGGATVISEASRTASLSLWRQRELQVLYTLASGLTDMREFRLATKMYEEILVKDADNACFTYSTLARVCLLMGALKCAEKYFKLSTDACKDEELKAGLALLHSGYLNVCSGNYGQAPALFAKAATHPLLTTLAKNNAAASMLYSEQVKTATLF
ncbi:TRAPPC12 [Bugula neritina]|uniref:TRAPPC12 n=1 Tax=Bugula neritina TaxID=10212 RepID=A0A7J7JG53_BUGNE|nr:TRAPPC12 [Bugula neritina]